MFPAPGHKSFLGVFFKKQQNLLFLKNKKHKDSCSWRCVTLRAFQKRAAGLLDQAATLANAARPAPARMTSSCGV
jgi:hypothetical protein